MGTGAFLAHGHFGSSDAKFYGVELDSITGRISKQLYQKANIQVTGYENALLPDNYFDCVIGNVPFGNFQVNDPQYNRLHFPIHDYFFAKSIDKLRTGGIIAFITSSGTLDKKDDRARKYIAERCDLIGAVRLPNNAFKGSGTKIMTDVIFLQKRDTLRQQDEPWLHLAEDANGIAVTDMGGTKLVTSAGVETTVTIYDTAKDPRRTYNTDNSGKAANEDNYSSAVNSICQTVSGKFKNPNIEGTIFFGLAFKVQCKSDCGAKWISAPQSLLH